MVALAKLHLLVGDLDACQLQCTRLLEIDKDNDAAFLVWLMSVSLVVFIPENFVRKSKSVT